jgi:hypothetical protein
MSWNVCFGQMMAILLQQEILDEIFSSGGKVCFVDGSGFSTKLIGVVQKVDNRV